MDGERSEIELELDRLAAEATREHHCPSLAWGVVRGGDLIAGGGVGTVNELAPTVATAYRIASMTKSFSAAVTLLLRDEGALTLDAPIRAFAPELAGIRFPTIDAPDITVRDLLCMTSGLVSDDPWADRHLDLDEDEFDSIVSRPLVFAQPTGTEFEYSNFGYALLGRVVHRATGTRLQDHVTERLLRPLGMTATTWEQPDHDDWARPYRWVDEHPADDQQPAPAAGHWELEATPGDGLLAPMGGLWTNVTDLARWIGWLADAFPARDDTHDDKDDGPLRRASRRDMQTPQRWVGMGTVRGVESPSNYGYGVRILEEPMHGTVILHSGGLPGYGSNMRWTPRTATSPGVGVIALANVTYAPMGDLAARLHDALESRGTNDPVDPSVSDALASAAHRLVAVLDAWARQRKVARAELAATFADNVEPDEPYERRSASMARFGSLAVERIRPLNGAHVDVDCVAADGSRATVSFVLALHSDRLVQDYDVTAATDP